MPTPDKSDIRLLPQEEIFAEGVFLLWDYYYLCRANHENLTSESDCITANRCCRNSHYLNLYDIYENEGGHGYYHGFIPIDTHY